MFTFFYLAIFLVFWRFWPFLVPKKGIRQTFFKKWIGLSWSAWKNMQFSFLHHRLKTNIFWLPEQAHQFTRHPGVPPSQKVRHIFGENFYCIFELYSLCLAFRDQLIFFPPKMWKNLENFLEPSLLEATSNLSKFRPPSLWWTKYFYVFITRFGAF